MKKEKLEHLADLLTEFQGQALAGMDAVLKGVIPDSAAFYEVQHSSDYRRARDLVISIGDVRRSVESAIGGSSTSSAKVKAARNNGKLGGRPRNQAQTGDAR